MDIARYSIDHPVVTWLLILFCLFGGIWGFQTVGKLEDPAFTLKQALVVTPYPGATAEEVEIEVTEVLETAIQQLAQLDDITSKSLPGRSEITVNIKATYDTAQMPQIWDELRRKVNDAQRSLPEGSGRSMVRDDFGDVYGLFYAVTAPGLSDVRKRDLADYLRRELLVVQGVAKVTTAGVPTETIYIETSNERLASLGISSDEIISAIQGANVITSSGSVRVDDMRIELSMEPSVDSAEALAAVRIGRAGSTEQISLQDFATISRRPTELPDHLIRFNGDEAFTIAIAGLSDANIVEVGEAVDARLAELAPNIPLGAELHPIYEQHVVVSDSINGFLVNLASSVAIVIGVLCLFMGWRVGLVVGGTLFLTVSGTLFFMSIFSIEMERISLGALIIAMGMLVDNAIVVAEGMLVSMQRGMSARDAAGETAKRTQISLLGATVIGIMAFAGIGLSDDATGEFLFSLFAVILFSLMLSWLLAITVTPLLGHYVLRPPKDGDEDRDPYGNGIYGLYRGVLNLALRGRRVMILALVLLTGASFYGFGFVKQSFFPASNTPMFFVDYWLPQGSDIHATEEDLIDIEPMIEEQPGVVSVASFIGQGASRYTLTYQPEQPNTAYGQFIIRTQSREQIEPLAARIGPMIAEDHPDAQVHIKRIVFGPGGGAKIQARFSGRDAAELRRLGAEAEAIFAQSGVLKDIRQNWRQRQPVIVPQILSDRAKVAGIDRRNISEALEFATTGRQAGVYRDGSYQLPIVARPTADERTNVDRLRDRLIWSPSERVLVPITQVVSDFETQYHETLIRRRNRVRTLTVEAEPAGDLTAAAALAYVKSQVDDIPLSIGYDLEWGGEYESSGEAQAALGAQLPLSLLVMLTISVLLFSRLRQPLIIWLVVPMSLCGVVIGLLGTGLPFSFTALLGLLSLSGMLIKNGIVLVDEIDEQVRVKGRTAEALTLASVSRLRPVMLAAVTTILGMLPLLTDAFFSSMAVTIMGGLAFATILTLIAIPVLYGLMFGIRGEKA